MNYLKAALFTTVLMTGGMGLVTPAMADEPGMRGGMHGGYGMRGGEQHGWKATLTDEQEKQIARLKLDYKKKAMPLKGRIQQAKVELALLITTDKPNQNDINKKIDEITKLKAEKMRLKAAHKIEVRKVLNEEQRVQFDLRQLKKASGGKDGHGGGGHGYGGGLR